MHVAEVPLTDEQKKLYLDNAKSRAKLCVHVSDDLLQPMLTAGGDKKKSLFLMKHWFEENYAEVEVEESLQDLTCEFNMLHPGDFKHSMFYVSGIDNCNAHLAKVNATGKYKMDDLQLINAVLSKLPDNKDGKTSEKWAPFQAKYHEQGKILGMTWVEFKKHLTREWKQIGLPSGGKLTGKALNVTTETPGSKYFPFKCNHCGKAGHKAQHCPERLAGKPKQKKNGFNNLKKKSGKGGGSPGNKPKKDLSDIKCYNCGEFGHYKNKCPKLCSETVANIEVALMVKCVSLQTKIGVNTPKCGDCVSTCNHCVATCTLYCVVCGDSQEYVKNDSGVNVITLKYEQANLTGPLYCSECKESEESVEYIPEQATSTTEQSCHVLTDDFFDDFSSDESEELDSNFKLEQLETTPLWWFDVCDEDSNCSICPVDHGETDGFDTDCMLQGEAHLGGLDITNDYLLVLVSTLSTDISGSSGADCTENGCKHNSNETNNNDNNGNDNANDSNGNDNASNNEYDGDDSSGDNEEEEDDMDNDDSTLMENQQ